MSTSAPSIGCVIFYWNCNIGRGQKELPGCTGGSLRTLGPCQCWGAAPAAPRQLRQLWQLCASLVTVFYICYSVFLGQKLWLWSFPAGEGDARQIREKEPVIGKGNCKVLKFDFCSLLSLPPPPPHLLLTDECPAVLVLAIVFTNLMIFGVCIKLLI